MQYWLIKTEPEEYSFDDLIRDGNVRARHGVPWDGVRNYQARNNLKKMKKGDLVLVYHSGKMKEIVGISKVAKEHYPDPKDKTGTWVVVELIPVRKLKTPFTLEEIKKCARHANGMPLQNIPLLKQARLSVMPVTKKEYDFIVSFK